MANGINLQEFLYFKFIYVYGSFSCMLSRISCAGDSEVDKSADSGKKVPSVSQLLPKNVDINEGEPLILEAKFDGTPPPNIKW